MRAIVHQAIKVYRLSFFLFAKIVFERLIRLREGIEWPHSRMDVWETVVGRPPQSNASMMLLFAGEEEDIIAASDKISYLLLGLSPCVRSKSMPIRTAIFPTHRR